MGDDSVLYLVIGVLAFIILVFIIILYGYGYVAKEVTRHTKLVKEELVLDAKYRKERFDRDMDLLKGELKESRKEYDSLKREIGDLKIQQKQDQLEYQIEKNKLNAEICELNRRLSQTEEKLQDEKEKNRELTRELNELRNFVQPGFGLAIGFGEQRKAIPRSRVDEVTETDSEESLTSKGQWSLDVFKFVVHFDFWLLLMRVFIPLVILMLLSV